MRTDTERLDWLEANKGQYWGWSVEIDRDSVSIAQCTQEYHEEGYEAPTLREAIDKAMELKT